MLQRDHGSGTRATRTDSHGSASWRPGIGTWFTRNIDTSGGFILDAEGGGIYENSKQFSNVTPGLYTVVGARPLDRFWFGEALVCSDSNEPGPPPAVEFDDVSGTATINLGSGETVTCTWYYPVS